jgi:hypothetical protein
MDMNLKNTLLIGICSFLLIFPPTVRVVAADEVPLQGKVQVNDCCVTIVNPDGSIVPNLDVGATYPIFAGMMIITDETGKVTLKVPDGRYVVFPNSEYSVKDIGAGNTGLGISEAKKGKACYCFSREGQYLIDSVPADLKNHAPTTAPASASAAYGRESSLGLTTYLNGISYVAVWQGVSDFDSDVVEAGEAACKPGCDNPRDDLGGLVDCCAPDLAPLWIGGAAAAAAIGGGIVGVAVTNSNDEEGTSFTPQAQ